jgi:hypothetical protein
MKKGNKITNPVCKFSVTFDDIAEGRVRLFVDGALQNDVHFFTYGQALEKIDELRDAGWLPLTPNVEAIEALLRTAEKYHIRMAGRDGS